MLPEISARAVRVAWVTSVERGVVVLVLCVLVLCRWLVSVSLTSKNAVAIYKRSVFPGGGDLAVDGSECIPALASQ